MSLLQSALIALGAGAAALPAYREWRRRPVTSRDRDGAPGQFAQLKSGLTHFDWIGPVNGPVAVCVHGLTTPSFVWLGLIPHLNALGFRVLIYDLYGRGLSSRPYGLQSPGFHTDQLTQLLDHEEVGDDITLIGYSMGGAISAAFAAKNTARLRRLILLAPAGMGHELGRVAKWTVDWPLIGDWLFHMAYPGALTKGIEAERDLPSSIENVTDRILNETMSRGYFRSVLSSLRGTMRRDMSQQHRTLAATSLPITAIWGEKDTVIPLRAMGTLTQWNRTVQHEVIPDAGHSLGHTHAEDVARIIHATWM